MFPMDEAISYGDARILSPKLQSRCFYKNSREGAAINPGGNVTRFLDSICGRKFLDGLIASVIIVVPFVLIVVAFASSSASNAAHASFKTGFVATRVADAASLAANMLGLFFQCIFLAVQTIYSTIFLGKYGATPAKWPAD